MAQHFLLSSAAVTLNVARVARMSDAEARRVFLKLRWPDTGGRPVCPYCASERVYDIKTRQRYKCAAKGCRKQFSPTSGTTFAYRHLSYRDLLLALILVCNSAKGISSIHLRRDLGVAYKTAFTLQHKLRQATRKERLSASRSRNANGVRLLNRAWPSVACSAAPRRLGRAGTCQRMGATDAKLRHADGACRTCWRGGKPVTARFVRRCLDEWRVYELELKKQLDFGPASDEQT